MATKNYMINDKWLDLDKQNIVELQSVDGELDSLKVNGSEIVTPSGKITITENGTDIDIAQYALADVNVEGGGGSSDFSTANVRLVCTAGEGVLVDVYNLAFLYGDSILTTLQLYGGFDETLPTVLYKSTATVSFSDAGGGILNISVTGNATVDPDNDSVIIITGDCTITIS